MRSPRRVIYVFLILLFVTLVFNIPKAVWHAHECICLLQLFFLLGSLTTLALSLISTKSRFSFSYIDVIILASAFYVFILVVLKEPLSFFDEKIVTSLCLIFLFFFIKIIFPFEEGMRAFFVAALFMGLFASLYGIAQFFHFVLPSNGAFRMTSFFGNPGPFSGYLVSILPLAFGILYHESKSKIICLIAAIVICIIFFVLLIIESRSAWIAAAAVLLFLFRQHVEGVKKIVRRKFVFIAILLLLMLVTVLAFSFKTDSARGRVLIWKVSYEMWKDSPAIGLGPGQFAVQYNDYQARYFHNNPEAAAHIPFADNTYFAFNELIQIAVEYGLVGVALFVLLLLVISQAGYLAHGNGEVSYMKASLTAILVFGLFSYPFNSISINVIFVVCLAFLSLRSRKQLTVTVNVYAVRIMACLLFVFAFCVTYKVIIRYVYIKEWQQARRLLDYDEKERAFEKYRVAYPFLRDHGEFLYNYGAELSEAGFYEESLSVLTEAKTKFNHIDLYIFLGKNYEALRQYNFAEAAYMHAAAMIPSRLFPKYLLVQLYRKQHRQTEALALAQIILKMNNKGNSFDADLIKEEMMHLLYQTDSLHK